MLETLQSWLNGTREYNIGVAIYNVVGNDTKLKALFSNGNTLYNRRRLDLELQAACDTLKKLKKDSARNKEIAVVKPSPIVKTSSPAPVTQNFNESKPEPAKNALNEPISANPQLYEAARNEAVMLYKETMNARALLFSMIPVSNEDPNRADLVAGRMELALRVVRDSIRYSELFDRAAHVKEHGQLPDHAVAPGEEEIPDAKVKQELDNARKALSKLKLKSQTAARMVLIQNHEQKIKILDERWLSLKQKT